MNEQDTISVEEFQENSLPLYYRETYFSSDTTFYTEHTGSQYGVAGDSVPYTVRGDDLLSSLLLVCFIFLVVSLSKSKRFIGRQIKDIFFTSHTERSIHETSIELRFQLILAGITCLVLSISSYQYTVHYVDDIFYIDNNLTLITLFFIIFIGYFILKALLYFFVNTIFFNSHQNRQWQITILFIIASEGVLIFPAMMLLVYFDLSPQKTLYYIIFSLLLLKIVTIYKCWNIFFSQNGGFLQTFLYFCTLEIIPLFNLVSGMLILIDSLKLNF